MENHMSMSLSPHQIFGRLQELKNWQQTHEKLLQRSVRDEAFNKFSKHDHLLNENLYKVSDNNFEDRGDVSENFDEQYIGTVLDKDFEELLEEKLNEYNEHNIVTNDPGVPKRPFLKKGTGLLKYNLKPEEYKSLIGNKYSNTILPRNSQTGSLKTKKKTVQFRTERPKSVGSVPKSVTLKKTQNNVRINRTCSASTQRLRTTSVERKGKSETNNKKITNRNEQQRSSGKNPVRNSNTAIENTRGVREDLNHPVEKRTFATKHVIQDTKNSLPQKSTKDESERKPMQLHDFLSDVVNKPAEHTPLRAPEISIKPKGNWCDISACNFQSEVLRNMNLISNNNAEIFQSQWKSGFTDEKILEPGSEQDLVADRIPSARKSLSFNSNDNSLYERAVETELKIFEALERKTEQTGFCSTNTSIIQLLASTPSKFNFKNSEMNTEDNVISEDDAEQLPLEFDENQDIAYNASKWEDDGQTNFMHNPQTEDSGEDTETDEEVDRTLENDISKSEDYHVHRKESSTNTDRLLLSRSSYTSSSSDISSDYLQETPKDYRCSSSPVENKNLESSESCASCGFLLKNKIEECQSELEILKIEKNRIMAIREQMDKDKKEFEKEMKLRRIQFEEQKLRYQLEIEEERKKIAEKKEPTEKHNKDTKSKIQLRKEKEELNNLRMELSETKELMKLKDTKNAMSVARLRNQVKILEKNNAELKAENEKLIKEKSKLVAQQKSLNKTNETKMLKEISKNISKLTEETFKNQTFKVDSSSEDFSKKKLVNGGSRGDCSVNMGKQSNTSMGILKQTQSNHQNNLIEDCSRQNNKGVENNIEEKYESLFGGNEVVIEENRIASNSSFGNKTRTTGLEKTEKILEDGTKEIKYSNGNIKRISENGTMRYYYASNDTWHTNFPDGTEVIEFSNGQSEKRFKDGKCLIFFPDGLIQTIFPDGTEEVKYPDGSKLLTRKDGDRLLFLTNGQVEIHTKDQKRREYPDGTVKILYPDGAQETRYSNGRIRMKNSQGQIILDTGDSNI